MQYLDYIKNNNPVIFQIFKNAYNRNRLAHAYLFAGSREATMDQEALFLVQVLISKNPFEGDFREITNYLDLEVIESTGVIKKEVVTTAVNRLQEKALEAGGKKILLIKSLEKASPSALNSLLKFLEEPTPHTHLIFTTNNVTKILSTVKSRMQIINVKNPSQAQITADFTRVGINKANARLLADFTFDIKQAKKWHFEDLAKYKAKFLLALEAAPLNSETLYTELFAIIQAQNANLFINLLNAFFNDLWRQKNNLATAFSSSKLIANYLALSFDYKAALFEVNEFAKAIRLNVNFELCKSNFLLKLKGLYG